MKMATDKERLPTPAVKIFDDPQYRDFLVLCSQGCVWRHVSGWELVTNPPPPDHSGWKPIFENDDVPVAEIRMRWNVQMILVRIWLGLLSKTGPDARLPWACNIFGLRNSG